MHYKFFIVVTIIFIALYLIILGYNENTADHKQDYLRTVGNIIEKDIESDDSVEFNQKTKVFQHKKTFRIKLTYKYKVKDKEYIGSFYNDGNDDNFLGSDEYIPIGNKYKYVRLMNVYYNKYKPHDSCTKIENINKKWRRMYYFLSFGLLFVLPFIIFI